MKKCSKCSKLKELSEFWKDNKAKDGLNSRCKQCTRVAALEYYRVHKESRKEYTKEYGRTHKMEAKARSKKYRDFHKIEIKEYTKEYYKMHKDEINKKCKEYSKLHKTKRKDQHIKYAYGITSEEYDQIFLEQDGKCKICGIHQNELKRNLAVDHNHMTGKVRGLLCTKCNTVLGLVNDDPVLLIKAEEYLESFMEDDEE
jgi:hypothetical protein